MNSAPGGSASCVEKPGTNNGSGLRCINGTDRRSRGYNRCLSQSGGLVPNAYPPNGCYGLSSPNDYIESIAQARLVQRLDSFRGDGDPDAETGGVISSRLQWEVRLTPVALQYMSGLGAGVLARGSYGQLAPAIAS